MPVHNSNSKIPTSSDLAIQLLQILVPLLKNVIACCVKKGNLHFSYVLEDFLLGKNIFKRVVS